MILLNLLLVRSQVDDIFVALGARFNSWYPGGCVTSIILMTSNAPYVIPDMYLMIECNGLSPPPVPRHEDDHSNHPYRKYQESYPANESANVHSVFKNKELAPLTNHFLSSKFTSTSPDSATVTSCGSLFSFSCQIFNMYFPAGTFLMV